MRRFAWVALALAVRAGVVHADPPPKPDPDLFGPGIPPPAKPKSPSAILPACIDQRAFGCVLGPDDLDAIAPQELTQYLEAKYLLRLPVADLTHDQVASFAQGASRDEAGPIFGGATGLENRWTIEGAPADDIRTGGIGTRVPLIFLDGIRTTAGGFAARDRTSNGGTIDAQLLSGAGATTTTVDANVWLAYNATGRRRPIADNTYNIGTIATTPGPELTLGLVARGPIGKLLDGRAWYAAGVAPSLGWTAFDAKLSRLVDVDQNGTPDGFPGQLTNDVIQSDHRTVMSVFAPVMARAGWDSRDATQHLELSIVGDISHSSRFLANATPQASGVDRTDIVGDAIATWRGSWDRTHVKLQLAWHHSYHDESAHDPAAANIPQLESLFLPPALADAPALAAACSDTAGDPYPKIINCPVPGSFFNSGGAGLLVQQVGDHPSATFDIARRVSETHVIRVGGTVEDSTFITRSRYTGDELDTAIFEGSLIRTHFIGAPETCPDMMPDLPCTFLSESELTYRALSAAAYAEDTWHVTPDIIFDGGLRWELMWVGTSLHFSDQLSPRMGVAWDFLGNQQSRVWLSMGRSYAFLPAGLGVTITGRDNFVDDTTVPQGTGRNVTLGNPITVVSGVKPVAQDEATGGVDVSIGREVRFTGWVQGRWLRYGLDTTELGLDNPGAPLPAARNSVLATAEVSTNPIHDFVLRAGYIYGLTVGSSTGPFDPRQGAVLYAGSDYDTTYLNLFGPLPTDYGSRFYFEADRTTKVSRDVSIDVAMRMTVASGKPRDVLANTDIGIVELLPRGTAGRWPLTSQANLRVGVTVKRLQVMLDVFNLFDRQQAQTFDEVYTNGIVRPIVGGTQEDLVFLRDESSGPVTVRKAYNLPLTFQAAPTIVLGVRHSF